MLSVGFPAASSLDILEISPFNVSEIFLELPVKGLQCTDILLNDFELLLHSF
jgi:hypothetical protein